MRPVVLLLLIVTMACSGPAGKPAAAVSSHPSSSSPAGVSLSTGGIVEYALPDPPVKPADCYRPCLPGLGSVARGSDGNIWFTDSNRKVIGRITPDGHVKQFSVSYELVGGAQTIAAGPDGNVYVNASGGGGNRPDWILRVTPAGQITQLSAGERPAGQNVFGSGPESITAGPDGNMWFTTFWTNRVARLSPTGSLTEFPIPTPNSAPRGITVGPDGNLWFVESTRAQPAIARITPMGVITEFPITSGPADVNPWDIVAGPDGNLWFTTAAGISRMTTQGAITPVALPQGSRPGKLVVAPDGNIWYADLDRASIVRLSVSGATRAYPLPRPGSSPTGMAVGADGRIWFGESEYGLMASIGIRVPELLLDHRPLVFADASTKSVALRNVGDAPLAITGVRVGGLDTARFLKSADSCSGKSLAPDASCTVELRRVAGGPAGLQSALLEVSDNGTGSPQRLSLLAQVPQCSLPVIAGGDATSVQGAQFDVRQARLLYDPYGSFESGGAASGVRTKQPPGLVGAGAGYYDRTLGRWLPVYGAAQVSPDGYRYVYLPVEQFRSEVHIVDAVSGTEKVWKIRPDFWSVAAFTSQGVYLHTGYEGIGAGLWLLDPDSGAFKTVFTNGRVALVNGTDAWLINRNPADKLPDVSAMGGATNEILKRDLVSGKTATWLYRPGTILGVAAVAGGKPIVSIFDGDSTTYWIMSGPNQTQRIDIPFSQARYPNVRGFVGDANGVWVGSDDGVYLWTPRTNSVLMVNEPATPAGTCA